MPSMVIISSAPCRGTHHGTRNKPKRFEYTAIPIAWRMTFLRFVPILRPQTMPNQRSRCFPHWQGQGGNQMEEQR